MTATAQPVPPPPPPPTPKGSRKTLIAVVVIVVIVAAAVGVYLATRSGGGGPSPSVTPTPTSSAAATPTPTPTSSASATPTPTATATSNGITGASSLQFSADVSSGGTLQETYVYYVKNIGTSSLMFRIEGTGSQGDFVYIINGAQQSAWIYENGQWMDLSSEYSSQWSTWNSAFTGYKGNLASYWSGSGDYTYTSGGNTVRIYSISVNPSLADSLFQHG
jgi:hypothetical protein